MEFPLTEGKKDWEFLLSATASGGGEGGSCCITLVGVRRKLGRGCL